MSDPTARKVTADHLSRGAYLYVRQSSLKQVLHHTESARRQYDLRRRARALGWPDEQIVVIDTDQGRSGADSDREGFQHLVTEVSMGRAGIVLGLEVSRLARNNADWHRLLELCALSDTLILDEEGIYDPASFNDRLLLGLKGTMSEAELHVMKARLLGGQLSKARRGELKIPLPVGLTYDPLDRIVLDPDVQVRETLKTFFKVYRRCESATAVVAHFRRNGLPFPYRDGKGYRDGELLWRPLTHSMALRALRNPGYAGAYAYGRTRQRMIEGRRRPVKVAQSEWIVLIKDHHPGYITWEQYEQNRKALARAARAFGSDRRGGPPREGPALLQGLCICGVCGRRMTVRYANRGTRPRPIYVCQRDGIEHARPVCQTIPGQGIDEAIGALAVELMAPHLLELALKVRDELERRFEEADALRGKSVERSRAEADLARRRYQQVDPANRLVADILETEWNRRLQDLDETIAEYERGRARDRRAMGERQRRRIRELSGNFPAVWRDPETCPKQRKRMLRLLIEDVTLLRDKQITLGIRLRSGATRQLALPLPQPAYDLYRTDPNVVASVAELLRDHTYSEAARVLNEAGLLTPRGNRYSRLKVRALRRAFGFKSLYQNRRDQGLLNSSEMAARLGIKPDTVNCWRSRGLLAGCCADDRGTWLYPWPENPPARSRGPRNVIKPVNEPLIAEVAKEVQYAT